MKVVLLAGGLGAKVQHLVPDKAKPMADICGRPFLWYLIQQLKKQKLTDLVVCLHYLPDSVISFLRDGKESGLSIKYSIESKLMGTGGALKQAESLLKVTKEPFFVINGDTYLELDYHAMAVFHKKKAGIGTIALSQVTDIAEYGLIKTEEDAKITLFGEKLRNLHIPGQINGGVYVLEPEILDLIAPNEPTSLEKEVFPSLLYLDRALYGYKTEGLFVDIGLPEQLERARLVLPKETK